MYYLEARNIVKQYASHKALDNVTIQVPENSIYGLLGPNGAGKTTLIRIINHITGPDSGEVYLDGRLSKPSDVENIGYLPEERGLYKKMKVGEQLLYLARLKGLTRNDAKEQIRFWLEKFDIAQWEKKKVEELSKGMQQKIQFHRHILPSAEVFVIESAERALHFYFSLQGAPDLLAASSTQVVYRGRKHPYLYPMDPKIIKEIQILPVHKIILAPTSNLPEIISGNYDRSTLAPVSGPVAAHVPPEDIL
jgi:ABC-type cobalamin/Fe3+-siderophores transport system ATPase subunit